MADNKGVKANHCAEIKEIISYLNEVTEKKYRPCDASSKLIRGRMSEGFTVEDFKSVIDNMASRWKNNPEMDQYLRPDTLFRPTKFQGYLNAGVKKQKAVDPRMSSSHIADNEWLDEKWCKK